jgi:hypothetical protein
MISSANKSGSSSFRIRTWIQNSQDLRLRVFASTAIVLLWSTLILPSAFLNGLFPLDVGGVLDKATHFPEDVHWILSPYNGSGRYFPLYWLYYAFLFQICGVAVQGYYLVQSAIFLLSVLMTSAIFVSIARNTIIVLLFGLSIFVSSPNVETLYTLGKAEPLLYLFISFILFVFYFGSANRRPPSFLKGAAITLAFACSMWSKETSVALFAFAIAGTAGALFLCRVGVFSSSEESPFRPYVNLLVCLGLGLSLAKLPFLLFAGSRDHAGSSYTSFSLSGQMIMDNVLFYLGQQPDVTITGLLATLLISVILLRGKPLSDTFDHKSARDLIFVVSLLVTAWVYLSIFLVWRWSMAYYLFLPAIIFRFVAGYGIYMLIQLRAWGRAIRLGSLVAMSVLGLHTAIYLWYTGSIQIRYSRMYTDALREYVKASHPGDSLIFESYPFYAEQVENTNQVLNLVFHVDRHLYGIADLVDPAIITREMRELLSVSDADLKNNEKNLPKKDDFIVSINGNELGTWQVRGVGPFYSDSSFLQKDGSYDMEKVAENRSYFPALLINVWTDRPAFMPTYVGYKLYRVTAGPRFNWLGRYPDGWMGRQARLILYPNHISSALVHVSTSEYNPGNAVCLYRDDVLLERASLSVGNEHTFKVTPVDKQSPTVFRFEVERTFVPRTLHLNKDKRELGAFIRLEPFAAKRP